MIDPEKRYLPDREIAFHYTVAMLYAQELEENLQAILYTINYSQEDLEFLMNGDELDRYRTFEKFIEKATAGKLKEILQKVIVSSEKKSFRKFWKDLSEAIKRRNILAHSFLQNLVLPPPTTEQREAIIHDLEYTSLKFYKLTLATRKLRAHFEEMSKQTHKRINDLLNELGYNPIETDKSIWENRE